MPMQVTLGGGCFWCIEAVMNELEGVQSAVNGYTGGHADDPTYEQVCSGRTGHAEVVQVTFDEAIIPLPALLEVFFSLHDPTTKDRQGGDVGTQYRSCVFVHDDADLAVVEASMAEVQAHFDQPLVTQVAVLEKFWPAEAYHQDYYARNTTQGYCQAVISPKMAKLRQKWAHRLKATTA